MAETKWLSDWSNAQVVEFLTVNNFDPQAFVDLRITGRVLASLTLEKLGDDYLSKKQALRLFELLHWKKPNTEPNSENKLCSVVQNTTSPTAATPATPATYEKSPESRKIATRIVENQAQSLTSQSDRNILADHIPRTYSELFQPTTKAECEDVLQACSDLAAKLARTESQMQQELQNVKQHGLELTSLLSELRPPRTNARMANSFGELMEDPLSLSDCDALIVRTANMKEAIKVKLQEAKQADVFLTRNQKNELEAQLRALRHRLEELHDTKTQMAVREEVRQL
jgi:hypothetical protein